MHAVIVESSRVASRQGAAVAIAVEMGEAS